MLFPSGRGERERAYSPSLCVPDIQPYLDRYAVDSAACRLDVEHQTFRYADGPRAELDVFAESDDRVHLFFQGGYWQQLSKSDASFPAAEFSRLGFTYIAAGYDLCPQVSLGSIVEQARAAVRWTRARYPNAELTVSGSSAGAHLAAWVGQHEPIDRLILLSGVYDLRPLVGTYINEAVGLNDPEAANLSPLLHIHGATTIPTSIHYGSNETDAFKAQSQQYADALAEVGRPMVVSEVEGRNHFDLVHDLSRL